LGENGLIISKGEVQNNQFKFREELPMIVVRNVFRLKFGKAKEAVALLKEGIATKSELAWR
jgi:hypothetical protein